MANLGLEDDMLLVVAYDVADDRCRARLHTLLLGYGTAIQESLFECLVTERQAGELKRKVAKTTRNTLGADKVRYYILCGACAVRIEDGAGRTQILEATVVVV